MYFIIDNFNNIIDEDKNEIGSKYLCDVLNANKLDYRKEYRIVEVDVEGQAYEGLNTLTYLYRNGIPYRLILNQLGNIMNIVSDIPKNNYGNYEVLTRWFIKED